MHSPATGERFVLYLPRAKEVFDDLDSSLSSQIEAEISKFLDAFAPATIFDSQVSKHVHKIKKDRSSVRAFGSYWDGGDIHVCLVLAVYKKADEDDYWDRAGVFETVAKGHHEQLDDRHADGTLVDKLKRLGQSDDYRLLLRE